MLVAPAILALAGAPAMAQDSSQSEAAAREIAQLMKQHKLECLAAVEPDAADRFVAALYFPNQLLVVSARYASPALLRERVLTRDYRGVYEQLQGAGDAQGKLFVHDLGVDGLHLRPTPERPLDMVYQSVNMRTAFDGDWSKQGLSEQQYRERFRVIDQQYARLLQALVAQGKTDGLR
jgi:hypothetical protein